jgi:para-nitrobenzyl esterase
MDLQYGKKAKKVLKFYPANTDEEATSSQKRIVRDRQFGIQNYTWANVHAKESTHPVYLYRFTRKLPATGDYVKYGAFHTGEVAYAYGNLRFVERCPWQPVDYALEKTMLSYWANFVATGNPNGEGLPQWPAYTTKDNMTMILGENPVAKPLPDKKSLDFLINAVGQ